MPAASAQFETTTLLGPGAQDPEPSGRPPRLCSPSMATRPLTWGLVLVVLVAVAALLVPSGPGGNVLIFSSAEDRHVPSAAEVDALERAQAEAGVALANATKAAQAAAVAYDKAAQEQAYASQALEDRRADLANAQGALDGFKAAEAHAKSAQVRDEKARRDAARAVQEAETALDQAAAAAAAAKEASEDPHACGTSHAQHPAPHLLRHRGHDTPTPNVTRLCTDAERVKLLNAVAPAKVKEATARQALDEKRAWAKGIPSEQTDQDAVEEATKARIAGEKAVAETIPPLRDAEAVFKKVKERTDAVAQDTAKAEGLRGAKADAYKKLQDATNRAHAANAIGDQMADDTLKIQSANKTEAPKAETPDAEAPKAPAQATNAESEVDRALRIAAEKKAAAKAAAEEAKAAEKAAHEAEAAGHTQAKAAKRAAEEEAKAAEHAKAAEKAALEAKAKQDKAAQELAAARKAREALAPGRPATGTVPPPEQARA